MQLKRSKRNLKHVRLGSEKSCMNTALPSSQIKDFHSKHTKGVFFQPKHKHGLGTDSNVRSCWARVQHRKASRVELRIKIGPGLSPSYLGSRLVQSVGI